ncbi:MAG: ribbon-helix-helix protein, CopG family [Bacteroidales bacterium]|nr:ribbon-helix-helix protein, CopG family [Bacteroidales bacterium]
MAHIGVRLSDQEKEMLEESAQKNDLTISQILRKLIRKYLGDADNGRRT